MDSTNSKFIIGLTGGIGSGKTAVSDYFAAKGIDIVDADVIARNITDSAEILAKIQQAFDDVVHDGKLNRAALRLHVFNNDAALATLNAITHPAIRSQIKTQLMHATSPYVILSVPLLLEPVVHGDDELMKLCQRILVVDVPESLQIARASMRDGQTVDNIKAIIAKQLDRQTRLSYADDVVDNSGSLDELYLQLDILHQKYLNLSRH